MEATVNQLLGFFLLCYLVGAVYVGLYVLRMM
jgi:hypothetical protein